MSMMTTAARWISGRTKLANDLPAAEDRLAEIEADPPKSADPAEHLEWVERRDAGRREVEALRSALAIATAEAAKAEAAQRDADDDAKHAAEERQARVDEKLVHDLVAAQQKVAAIRDKLAASIARTEAVNSRRGARPFILDAETRVRSKPGRIRPAITEKVTAWFGPDGRRYANNLATDEAGRTIEATDRVQREVVDVIHAESQDPPSMPSRFADAIRLVDLDGRAL